MKVSIKPVIMPSARRKDGTWAVSMRVTYRGKSRRLPTTLVCTASDLTRSGKIKNPTIIDKGEELARRMRAALEGLSPFELERADVDGLVAMIRERALGESFRLDFFEWGDRVVATKKGATKDTYITALNAFARFLGRRELDINDISKPLLLDFVAFLGTEGRVVYKAKEGVYVDTRRARVEGGVEARHMQRLAHIYNAAKERYNDEDTGVVRIPRSPFSAVKLKEPKGHGQKNLGAETMQRIIDAQVEDSRIRTALDLFMLSFLLMGANLADLWDARAGVGATWTYNRRKTATRRDDNAEMRVGVPVEAAPYLERLGGGGKWWLGTLHGYAADKDQAAWRVNKYLRRWAESEGLPGFTFYAARKTWASLARRAGVEKATIDECLCHVGELRMVDIYIEKDWSLLDAANRRVIDSLRWPER